MGYYKRHLFMCINEREDSVCCHQFGAQEMRDYVKKRAKELGIHGQGQVRVNNAGCLDRCSEGPVAVVYPDNVWYSYRSKEDLDEIIDSHLVKGEVVEHLRL